MILYASLTQCACLNDIESKAALSGSFAVRGTSNTVNAEKKNGRNDFYIARRYALSLLIL